MTLQRLAAKLVEGGVVAMVLLLAAPAIAAPDQSRQRPNDSGSSGRTAHEAPRSGGGSGGGSGSSSGGGGNSGESSGSTRESSPPRTAHPSPGAGNREPERQRSHRRGGSGRDGFRGDGYYGGSYGHYYDPFWGPFWWRFGWWGYYPYYGPGGYPYYRGDRWPGRDLGGLDLDVSPGRTEVYLDGRYLGKVDAYDGFPRYLWLEKGTYDVVFYLDGYRTIARQITIYPGTVIDVDDRMEPGDSVRPEDLGPKSNQRRDERLRHEREQRERYGRDGDDDWRDRVREERRRRNRDDVEEDEIEEGQDEQGRRHGRVSLDVEPRDASVYVDGRFVGTAEDLARSGLSLNPGRHHIAVVRPGHRSEERDFEVSAGQEVELEIELVAND